MCRPHFSGPVCRVTGVCACCCTSNKLTIFDNYLRGCGRYLLLVTFAREIVPVLSLKPALSPLAKDVIIDGKCVCLPPKFCGAQICR